MKLKQLRVALYVRTNRKSNEEVKKQENRLLQVCDENDYLIYDFYIDNGYSAISNNRVEYKRMLEDMKAKKFDLILTCRLSNIGRTTFTLTNFINLLDKYNCNFTAVDSYMNLDSKDVKTYKSLFETMYSMERSMQYE